MDFDDDEDLPRPNTNKLAQARNEMAEERTDLAFERSRLASDRTTMGYMRTATSLIGFGFSIPALFKVLTDVPGLEDAPVERARFVGLFMLFLAVFMLCTAILQQALFLRRLAKIAQKPFPLSVPLVACIGILAVAFYVSTNILFNLEPF